MHHTIVLRFPTIFVARSLDDGLASIEVKVLVGLGVEVVPFSARALAMLSTGTEARAQMEVVDAESDGGEEQAEQRRVGPINGVVVQSGLNHYLHSGKQFASFEPIDRVVPKQTEGFVQEGQVHFEVEVDDMGFDIHVLLLFGVEDGDFGSLMNPDWRSSGFANQLSSILFFRMDEPSVAGDLENLFPGGLRLKFTMLLDSGEVMADQRAQARSVHLGHGGGAARAEVCAAQLSSMGQFGFFQHLEDLLVVEGDVVFMRCARHHGVTHGRVEQDQCRHELVEFEHHYMVEEWYLKNESDRARAFRKIGKVH